VLRSRRGNAKVPMSILEARDGRCGLALAAAVPFRRYLPRVPKRRRVETLADGERGAQSTSIMSAEQPQC
jgi:hypothetical protein